MWRMSVDDARPGAAVIDGAAVADISGERQGFCGEPVGQSIMPGVTPLPTDSGAGLEDLVVGDAVIVDSMRFGVILPDRFPCRFASCILSCVTIFMSSSTLLPGVGG